MFESDQHEFDEFEELGHVAPPPPFAKPAVPAAAPQENEPAKSAPAATPVQTQPLRQYAAAEPVGSAAPAAVAEPIVEEAEEEEPEEYEYPEEQQQEQEEFVDPAEKKEEPPPPAKKKITNYVLMGGFAVLIFFTVFVVYTASKPKDNTPPPGDLGPGVVAQDGLRGHLTTRWDGNSRTGRLVYQLHVEPMEDRWQAGFSKVVLTAPKPISLNVRLMDATGFALCGKEIDLPFDPRNANVQVAAPAVGANGKKLSAAERTAAAEAERESQISQMRTAETAREHGKDVLQAETGQDGLATAVNVQGTLPCSPDQYRQANYWDFNTNFPTLDEQADLLDPRAAALRAKKGMEPLPHASRRNTSNRPQEGFVMQGDERVTEYDSVNGLLWTQGRTFQIDRRTGQATANAWANNNMLIHYRCDQQASCALTAAGGVAVLHARLNN
jgi:hypothetical protein